MDFESRKIILNFVKDNKKSNKKQPNQIFTFKVKLTLFKYLLLLLYSQPSTKIQKRSMKVCLIIYLNHKRILL